MASDEIRRIADRNSMHTLQSLEIELKAIQSWDEQYRQIPQHSKLDEMANRLRHERKKDIVRWIESLRPEGQRPVSVVRLMASKPPHS